MKNISRQLQDKIAKEIINELIKSRANLFTAYYEQYCKQNQIPIDKNLHVLASMILYSSDFSNEEIKAFIQDPLKNVKS